MARKRRKTHCGKEKTRRRPLAKQKVVGMMMMTKLVSKKSVWKKIKEKPAAQG